MADPPRLGAFSARPDALRHFASHSADWDADVLRIGSQVTLEGVRADMIRRQWLESHDPPVAMWVEEPPVPVDPATLVRLPAADRITAQALGLSEATALLAGFTASAVDEADAFTVGVAFNQLADHLDAIERYHGYSSEDAYGRHLQSFWLEGGVRRADIDFASWDPDRGVTANRPIVEQAFDYYGMLFLDHPEFHWAGMASVFAPSLDAAFDDIVLARLVAMHSAVFPEPFRSLGLMSAQEVAFYERTLAQMQYDVFVDSAVMHEAYIGGGIGAIRELHRAGVIDSDAAAAWELIALGSAEGNEGSIVAGNWLLLHREQNHVLREGYESMQHREVTGALFTGAMTIMYQPSIPGARSYIEVFPKEVGFATPSPAFRLPSIGLGPISTPSACIGLPQVSVGFELPLPEGNIADRNDRTALIQQDTWPAFQAARTEDPEGLRELIATPVRDRAGEYRVQSRVLDMVLADHSITHIGPVPIITDPATGMVIDAATEIVSRTSVGVQGPSC